MHGGIAYNTWCGKWIRWNGKWMKDKTVPGCLLGWFVVSIVGGPDKWSQLVSQATTVSSGIWFWRRYFDARWSTRRRWEASVPAAAWGIIPSLLRGFLDDVLPQIPHPSLAFGGFVVNGESDPFGGVGNHCRACCHHHRSRTTTKLSPLVIEGMRVGFLDGGVMAFDGFFVVGRRIVSPLHKGNIAYVGRKHVREHPTAVLLSFLHV